MELHATIIIGQWIGDYRLDGIELHVANLR